MARSKIEWLARPGTIPVSLNSIGGCKAKSEGCAHCYALRYSWRIVNNPKHPARYDGVVEMGVLGRPQWTGRINLAPEVLDQPPCWKKARTVFVSSMSDLFLEAVPFDFITSVFDMMANPLCQKHTFLLLTKHAKRMAEIIAAIPHIEYNHICWDGLSPTNLFKVLEQDAWPLPNVWAGVTTENQRCADERIPWLLKTPAAVRFVSAEPLLERLDLRQWLVRCPDCGERPQFADARWRYEGTYKNVNTMGHHHGYPIGHVQSIDEPAFDWLVAGTESGPNARTVSSDAFRWLRDQCMHAGIPYFLKQMHVDGKLVKMPKLDGVEHREWPEVSR